jgi:hypothetical protein
LRLKWLDEDDDDGNELHPFSEATDVDDGGGAAVNDDGGAAADGEANGESNSSTFS